MTAEQWRHVVGYEGRYMVSSFGNVRSLFARNRTYAIRLKPTKPSVNPYRKVQLYDGIHSEGQSFKVCVLVLRAFVGECPEGMESCHADTNCSNDRLDNQYWGTRKENMQDSVLAGKMGGENHYAAILTDAQVGRIREMGKQFTGVELARIFKVSKSLISAILLQKKRK
jgi:hypothetical protein